MFHSKFNFEHFLLQKKRIRKSLQFCYNLLNIVAWDRQRQTMSHTVLTLNLNIWFEDLHYERILLFLILNLLNGATRCGLFLVLNSSFWECTGALFFTEKNLHLVALKLLNWTEKNRHQISFKKMTDKCKKKNLHLLFFCFKKRSFDDGSRAFEIQIHWWFFVWLHVLQKCV